MTTSQFYSVCSLGAPEKIEAASTYIKLTHSHMSVSKLPDFAIITGVRWKQTTLLS